MTTEPKKPRVRLSGQNGNIYNLTSLCALALKRAGQPERAEELKQAVTKSQSYDEALQQMMKFCDVY